MSEQGKCETLVNSECECCNEVATFRYPAMGGGYMHLCDRHGIAHADYSEVWGGDRWVASCDSSGDATEQSGDDRRER